MTFHMYPECPVCECRIVRSYKWSRDFIWSGEKFSLVECAKCGFIFTNPRPATVDLPRYYPASYYTRISPSEVMSHHDKVRLASARRRLRQLAAYCARGRLLDVGSGDGLFLQLSNAQGCWQAVGVERDIAAAVNSRHSRQVDTVCGDALMLPFLERSFDVVTCWDVLEHVPWPRQVVREFHRVLRPGGVVACAVPNIHSLEARLWGPFWGGLDVPRHLNHFSMATLRYLFYSERFHILHADHAPVSYHVASLQLLVRATVTRRRAYSPTATSPTSAPRLHALRSPLGWARKRAGSIYQQLARTLRISGSIEIYCQKV